jgi:hypothetical protein
MKPPDALRLALVLASATALAAACGVANPFAPTAASNGQDQLLKWAQCMRQHGVDVPDPVNGRIVFHGNRPDPNSSQFQAAQNACKRYQPNGGNGTDRSNQQQLDQMTKFAQCMREHGIAMSDPQVLPGGGISMPRSSPAPGQPAPDPNSDQFEQAQQACSRYLPGGGTGGTK